MDKVIQAFNFINNKIGTKEMYRPTQTTLKASIF